MFLTQRKAVCLSCMLTKVRPVFSNFETIPIHPQSTSPKRDYATLTDFRSMGAEDG